MSGHAYNEDQLVEQPAIQLLAELGWDIAFSNPHPSPLPEGEVLYGNPGPLVTGVGVRVDETGLLGRETNAEVVLEARLRAAIERLNPSGPMWAQPPYRSPSSEGIYMANPGLIGI
jgi:type I restriction enzyme, R subunit